MARLLIHPEIPTAFFLPTLQHWTSNGLKGLKMNSQRRKQFCLHARSQLYPQAQRWQRKSYSLGLFSHPVDISGFTPAKRSTRDQRKLHHTAAALGNVTARARQQTSAAFSQHPFEVQRWIEQRRQERIHQRLRLKAANTRNTIKVTFHTSGMRKTASPWFLRATPWPSASSRVQEFDLWFEQCDRWYRSWCNTALQQKGAVADRKSSFTIHHQFNSRPSL